MYLLEKVGKNGEKQLKYYECIQFTDCVQALRMYMHVFWWRWNTKRKQREWNKNPLLCLKCHGGYFVHKQFEMSTISSNIRGDSVKLETNKNLRHFSRFNVNSILFHASHFFRSVYCGSRECAACTFQHCKITSIIVFIDLDLIVEVILWNGRERTYESLFLACFNATVLKLKDKWCMMMRNWIWNMARKHKNGMEQA